MATLAGTNLGQINSETVTQNSGLFNQPLPRSNPEAAILMDLFGSTRKITIKGIYTAIDGVMSTFMIFLAGLNGTSTIRTQSAKTYISDKSYAPDGTHNWTNMLVDNCTITNEEAGINKVEYTIDLIQGSIIE